MQQSFAKELILSNFAKILATIGAHTKMSMALERVIELDLNDSEKAQFAESLAHVKALVSKVDGIL